jgi:hypothetical protein
MRFGVWRIDSGNTAVSSRTARGSCRETGALIPHNDRPPAAARWAEQASEFSVGEATIHRALHGVHAADELTARLGNNKTAGSFQQKVMARPNIVM